jgi:hypothetical protein
VAVAAEVAHPSFSGTLPAGYPPAVHAAIIKPANPYACTSLPNVIQNRLMSRIMSSRMP